MIAALRWRPTDRIWPPLRGLTQQRVFIIDTEITPGANRPVADERMTFTDLGVLPEIADSLAQVGITHPFPIQAMSIPIAINGTDMIGQARTGTGKTLAFGITTLQRILIEGDRFYDELEHPGLPQALIMCPTRELALQVTRDLQSASTIRKVRIMTVYGGVSYDPQLEQLKAGIDVVVGTPGRLLDLVQRGQLNLHHVRVVVLDEADEMLDLGFLPDVERLLSQTPKDRQTLLFSATMPSAIVSLARSHLSHPVNIRAELHDAQATVPDTTQFVYRAHDLDKPEIIGKLLQSPECTKTMIFTRTKRTAQRLSEELEDRGFSARSIHGDLSQDAREKSLKKFRANQVDVLVCTDVAARGIDVIGVSHVVNYECPEDEKAYIHRIGRTGRAGAKGVAITLVDWADTVRWATINKTLDLPFNELQETYSTSPHLFTDLQIPEGTKGRLPGSTPRQRVPREERGRGTRGSRDGGRSRSSEGQHTEKPKRERTRRRRRLKNGQPIEAATEATMAEAPVISDAPESAGAAPAPRRRRRRGSGRSRDHAPTLDVSASE